MLPVLGMRGPSWRRLPAAVRGGPPGWEAFLLVPLVVAGGRSPSGWAPLVERLAPRRRLPAFLLTALGLTYDQRNSLVVGIAMGFAVIPIIFTVAEDSISAVPPEL